MFKKINLLATKAKIQVVSGNPRSLILDTPPAKDVDRPKKLNNFARILKGQKVAKQQGQFKSILKVTY